MVKKKKVSVWKNQKKVPGKTNSFWNNFLKNKTLAVIFAVVIIAVLGASFWYFLSPNEVLAGQAVSSGKKCTKDANCQSGQACVADYAQMPGIHIESSAMMTLTKNKVCCSKGSCSFLGKCYPDAQAYSKYYECGSSQWFHFSDNINKIGPSKKTISDGNVWKEFGGKCNACPKGTEECLASNALTFDSSLNEWQIQDWAYKTLAVGCGYFSGCIDSSGKKFSSHEIKNGEDFCFDNNWFACDKTVEGKKYSIVKTLESFGSNTFKEIKYVFCSYDSKTKKYSWKKGTWEKAKDPVQPSDILEFPHKESVETCSSCDGNEKCVSSDILLFSESSWIINQNAYVSGRVGCNSDYGGCIDIAGKTYKNIEIKEDKVHFCLAQDWYKCDASSQNRWVSAGSGYKCIKESGKFAWKEGGNFDFCSSSGECLSGLKCTPVYSKTEGSAVSVNFGFKTSDSICCPQDQCGLDSPVSSCAKQSGAQNCQSDGSWS